MTHSGRLSIAALALLLALEASAAPGPPTPTTTVATLEVFSPQGAVKQVRQASARFSVDMVALGDPRLEDPFVVKCPAAGKGRWADTRNWEYDFDNDLPAGLSCTFTLRKGLKSLAGAAVAADRTYRFTTGGPAIIASYPREGWAAVDEEQVFLLKLDAAATDESVQAHASCMVQGLGEQIPVEVLAGEDRAAVLRERQALGYEYFQLLWKTGAITQARVRDRTLERAESEITVVRCARRLAPGARMSLRWGTGIRARSGIATTSDQTLAFRVRPAFTATVECTRVNARAGCMPMQPVTIRFSAPVPASQAVQARVQPAVGPEMSPTEQASTPGATIESLTFAGPFPEGRALSVRLPAALTDDAGRPLENASRFPLELRVDAYPPLAKFSGTFGILESTEGGVLPVTLRNVEKDLQARQAVMPAKLARLDNDPATIARWLLRVTEAAEPRGEMVEVPKDQPQAPRAPANRMGTDEDDDGESDDPNVPRQRWREDTGSKSVFAATDATRSLSIHKPSGTKPSEVIGIALKDPGFYVVEIESRRLGQSLLGRDQVRYVATAALVTNLAVHFEWGRESSLVWVTQLSDGAVVEGAEVVIVDYCNGKQQWQGVTGKDGTAMVSRSLGAPHSYAGCIPHAPTPLLVTAKKGNDLSFTQSGWGQGIEPQQFGLPLGSEWSSQIYHTVLDRSLFRAGETVSMKHFLRRHQSDGFAVADGTPGKRTVTIEHQGSGQHYELEVSFGADGIAENQWKIPAEAKLGDYTVSIQESGGRRQSGQFKVEQFRLPSMRATVTGPAKALVRPKSASLDLHVAYMSGGGASGLAVKLRTIVEPRPTNFVGYDDYQFGGKPVTEGIVTEANDAQDLDFEGEPDVQTPKTAQVLPLTLDANGSARVAVPNVPDLDGPAVLSAELEYADANGELLTSSGQVRLVPAAISVGIRREGWAASKEQLRFRVVVLDLDGKPVAGQPVGVTLYQSTAYSYRKRLIGGFYAYETTRQTRKLPVVCSGTTSAQGLLACEVSPGVSGEVIVRAEAKDSAGRPAGSTTSLWVVDQDSWWFGGTSGDRMDVLPEKKSYEPGDVARFQVRMPFRSATALVTIERQGVISSFVTHLDGKEPVIEVPITGSYAPNVFVSVLALRGRIPHADAHDPKPGAGEHVTALVDLNKPAYRLGLASVRVGWKAHRLDVSVAAEHPTYRVRDKATIHLHVARADGRALPAGAEVAVAAVDEALLDLASNPSWDVLKAMMGERGLEVWTSTAQMQVVGKRHYGRKAVAAGGGGGRDADRARELFDSLLFWKARLRVDEHGDAVVSVPLNDSLSAFRIVAVANASAGLFGTGSTVINTTQDLILLSGLPPLVREGDRYSATFTVRNTTDHAVTTQVAPVVTPGVADALPAQRIDLAAGQSRDVSWDVAAPVNASAVRWEVVARDTGGSAVDKLRLTQAVIPAFPVRTYQATITQLAGPFSLPVERPVGAIAQRGGLEIALRAHLGDGLDGVREYMIAYRYTCLEQRLSQAIALGDRAAWLEMMRRLPAYMDSDGLLKYFPSDALPGDDALTSYVLSVANEAGFEIPEAERERMIAGLTRFVAGRINRRSALPTADLAIRKLAAIEALARYEKAEVSMLDSLPIEPNLWPTSAVLDWLGVLKRLPGIPDMPAKRAQALQILRARLNFQGTLMSFSTERSDALWWLMISADSNALRMLLAVIDEPTWRADVPRLVRGALDRQHYGHWNTTVANAWGVVAMRKFSSVFESEPVTGSTLVSYGAPAPAVAWTKDRASNEMTLPWRDGKAPLDISHSGSGKPWAIVRATAAVPLTQPLSSGFKIHRTLTPVEQQTPGRWTRGDVARVHLDLEAQSDMSWVVVDDPVPAGATILGSGLGGQSKLLARGERREGWVWPAFEERRFDAFRSYYRFVPKGTWSVEYTVRLNNPGTFLQPSTRVEAMYAPEMFAEIPNANVVVVARP